MGPPGAGVLAGPLASAKGGGTPSGDHYKDRRIVLPHSTTGEFRCVRCYGLTHHKVRLHGSERRRTGCDPSRLFTLR